MTTAFILFVFGVIANFLFVFIGNIGGLPGAMLAGSPVTRSKGRFIFGSIVCAIGQSYIYLAYAAFVVSWTDSRIQQGFSKFNWIAAFLAVSFPLWINLIRSRVESREFSHANPQVEGMHLTLLIVIVIFFVFVFFDNSILYMYGWLPFIQTK